MSYRGENLSFDHYFIFSQNFIFKNFLVQIVGVLERPFFLAGEGCLIILLGFSYSGTLYFFRDFFSNDQRFLGRIGGHSHL